MTDDPITDSDVPFENLADVGEREFDMDDEERVAGMRWMPPRPPSKTVARPLREASPGRTRLPGERFTPELPIVHRSATLIEVDRTYSRSTRRPTPWSTTAFRSRMCECWGRFLDRRRSSAGLNYHDQAEERDEDVPERPLLFGKAPTAVTNPDDPIVRPVGIERVNYEVELGIVIGTGGKHVDADDAGEHVAGLRRSMTSSSASLATDSSSVARATTRSLRWTDDRSRPRPRPQRPRRTVGSTERRSRIRTPISSSSTSAR